MEAEATEEGVGTEEGVDTVAEAETSQMAIGSLQVLLFAFGILPCHMIHCCGSVFGIAPDSWLFSTQLWSAQAS